METVKTTKTKPAKKRTKPEDIDQQNYSNFLQGLRLKKIFVTKAEIDRDIEQKPGNARLRIRKTSEADIRDDNRGFLIHDRMILSIKSDEGKKPIVRIAVTLALEYESTVELDEDLLKVFSERNLNLHSWPYFREFVQNMILRTGLPPFVLPLQL